MGYCQVGFDFLVGKTTFLYSDILSASSVAHGCNQLKRLTQLLNEFPKKLCLIEHIFKFLHAVFGVTPSQPLNG